MIDDTPPDMLFRYRAENSSFFDDELEQAIHIGKTYCSPLIVQNDIFDSQPHLVAGKKEELELHIDEVRRELGAGYTPTGGAIAEINKEFGYNKKQLNELKQGFTDIDHQFEIAKMTLGSLRREMKIACFCEQYDLPLLWSHYADSHRGICLGYSTASQSKYFNQNVLPVTYMKERPIITVVELLRFSVLSRHISDI